MKFILLLFTSFSMLLSHPHTFIDIHPTLKEQSDSSTTLNFKWVLDDMTSSMLIMELDKNGDAKIDDRENTHIYNEYFSIFKDYNYYTFVKVAGKSIKLPKPKNFRATIENNKLCYSFDIEFKHKIKNIVLEFGDSDMYVAMILKKEFVNAKDLDVVVTGVDNDFYYGFRLEFK